MCHDARGVAGKDRLAAFVAYQKGIEVLDRGKCTFGADLIDARALKAVLLGNSAATCSGISHGAVIQASLPGNPGTQTPIPLLPSNMYEGKSLQVFLLQVQASMNIGGQARSCKAELFQRKAIS